MFKQYAKFEPILRKYLLAAILLAVPLYPKFPFIQIPGSSVAIRLEDLLIAFALFSILSYACIVGFRRFPLEVSGKAILLYLAIGAVSTLSAIKITNSVNPGISILHFLRRVEYFIPFFLAITVIKSKKDLLFYLEVIFYTTICILIYGIGQKYLNFPVISTQNEEYSKGLLLRLTPGARLNSTFAGHYDLAAFSVMILPIFLSLFLSQLEKWYRAMGVIGFLSSLWLLLSSSSRISFPAYLISIAILLFSIGRKRAMITIVVISLIFMGTSTELASRYIRTVDVYFSRISKLIKFPRRPPTEPPYQIESPPAENSTPTLVPIISTPTVVILSSTTMAPPAVKLVSPTQTPTLTTTPVPTQVINATATISPPEITTSQAKTRKSLPTQAPAPVIIEERSTSIRLNVEWPRAIRAFKKNPLLGTGFSSITLATDNDYLRSLGETGVLGLISFICILGSILIRFIPIFKDKNKNDTQILCVGIFCSMIGLLVNATFIDVFEASKVGPFFWGIMGIFIGSSLLTRKNKT